MKTSRSAASELLPLISRGPLTQDVQVHRRVLDQGQQAAVDVLDDHPLLGLSLPAALHQQVHLLRAGTRSFQFPSLRDAFNGLLGILK